MLLARENPHSEIWSRPETRVLVTICHRDFALWQQNIRNHASRMQASFLLILALALSACDAFRVAKTTVNIPTSLRLISVGRSDLPGAIGNAVFDPLGLSKELPSRELKLVCDGKQRT